MSDTTERPDPAPSPSAPPPAAGPPPAPEGTAAAPEGATPASESPAPPPAPETTPAPTAPDTAVPAPTAPDTAVPAPTAPDTVVPAPTVPQTVVPAPPAPQTVVPAPPAPETAVPAPPAPQTVVPAAALPVPAVPAPAPGAAAGGTAPPHAESSFFSRVKRVFNFETGVYPEVAGNAQATLEAILVVALATLFFGSFWSLLVFFITVPLALTLTAISAGLVTLSARLFNKESPGFAPWFRALAFAQAPLSLGIIPLVGSFIAMVYCIATSVAAIHRVARLPVGVAILTWVIAWLLPLAFLLFLAFLFGGLAFMGSLLGGMA